MAVTISESCLWHLQRSPELQESSIWRPSQRQLPVWPRLFALFIMLFQYAGLTSVCGQKGTFLVQIKALRNCLSTVPSNPCFFPCVTVSLHPAHNSHHSPAHNSHPASSHRSQQTSPRPTILHVSSFPQFSGSPTWVVCLWVTHVLPHCELPRFYLSHFLPLGAFLQHSLWQLSFYLCQIMLELLRTSDF